MKEVLAHAKANPAGPFGAVRGMLADLLQVDLQTATFIEVALGERAQHLVLAESSDNRNLLAAAERSFAGRVGFLNVANPSTPVADLTGFPGVIGRADQFVQIAVEHEPLVRHLLGNTWIVENLAAAFQLAEQDAARGLQFITVDGAVLEADGTLIVGPTQGAAGVISRRSELRVLAQNLVECGVQISTAEETLADLEAQTAGVERQTHELAAQNRHATEQLVEDRHRLRDAEKQQADCETQFAAHNQAASDAENQCQKLTAELAAAEKKATETQAAIVTIEAEMHAQTSRVAEMTDTRAACDRQTQAARIELVRSEQQLDNLRGQLDRHQQDRSERQQAVGESHDQLDQYLNRIREAEESILSGESKLAMLYLGKDSLAGEGVTLINHREMLRADRVLLIEEAGKRRARLRKLDDKLHKRELSASQLQHERSTLVQRLREDYGIELGDEPAAESAHSAGEQNSAPIAICTSGSKTFDRT